MRTLADVILNLASVKWLDWLGLILSVAVALATIISGAIGSHSLFHLGYEPTFRDIEVCLSLCFCFLLLPAGKVETLEGCSSFFRYARLQYFTSASIAQFISMGFAALTAF